MIYQQEKEPRNKNLTVRKRLSVANSIMIMITMIAMLVCTAACIFATIAWTQRAQTLSAMSNDDVLKTCNEISIQLTEAIDLAETGDRSGFESFESTFTDKSAYISITRDGEAYYSTGSPSVLDSNLAKAALSIDSEGYISSGNRQLYIKEVTAAGEVYMINIFIPKFEHPYRDLVTIAIIAIVGILIVFLLNFLVTSRFLSDYVFSKINYSLGTLERGVREIQSGNLDYRIDYDINDEFRPVVDSFNEMTDKVQTSTEALQHQEENRKALLASISHDLRSPLTTISAYSGGLLDGIAASPESQERYLRQINKKAGEMTDIVNRLFIFSKMDMDEYPTYPMPISLGKEVAAFVNAVSQEYEEKGLLISITGSDDCPVTADPEQLNTILANISENSLKYKTSEVGRLDMRVYEDGDSCVLDLCDDGPGVPEDDLDKLFEVFFIGDPARDKKVRGSGLGLAIVSSAVKRAGGTVTASNASPHGLRISIRLPKRIDKDANKSANAGDRYADAEVKSANAGDRYANAEDKSANAGDRYADVEEENADV